MSGLDGLRDALIRIPMDCETADEVLVVLCNTIAAEISREYLPPRGLTRPTVVVRMEDTGIEKTLYVGDTLTVTMQVGEQPYAQSITTPRMRVVEIR
jgi:hypothetical protein